MIERKEEPLIAVYTVLRRVKGGDSQDQSFSSPLVELRCLRRGSSPESLERIFVFLFSTHFFSFYRSYVS